MGMASDCVMANETYLKKLMEKYPKVFNEPLGRSEDEFDATYNCLECARNNFVDKEMTQILVDSCLKKEINNVSENATKVFCQEIDDVYFPVMIGNIIHMDETKNDLAEYLLNKVKSLCGMQAPSWLNTLNPDYIVAV